MNELMMTDEVKCKSCDNLVRRTNKFCGECGSKVETSWFASQAAKPNLCQGYTEEGALCGQTLAASDKFCAFCGARNNERMESDCRQLESGTSAAVNDIGAYSSNVATFVSDWTKCSICFETFTDPRSLPCLHTFCRQCLVGLFAADFEAEIARADEMVRHRGSEIKRSVDQQVGFLLKRLKGIQQNEQQWTIEAEKSIIDHRLAQIGRIEDLANKAKSSRNVHRLTTVIEKVCDFVAATPAPLASHQSMLPAVRFTSQVSDSEPTRLVGKIMTFERSSCTIDAGTAQQGASSMDTSGPTTTSDDPPVPIFAILPTGRTVTLRIATNALVSEIKRKIADKESIPIAYQRLTYAGRMLNDSSRVCEYGIGRDSSVMIFIRRTPDSFHLAE